MAFGDAYAIVAELELRLGRDDDGTFAGVLDAASRDVEAFTGRQFNRDTSVTPVATERRFRAVDPMRLPVDDFHTTTGLAVEVDGTAWLIADVDPRPWDGVYRGMVGWPFFDLMAVSRYWPYSRRAVVAVTAHWGWAAVPKGIKLATLARAEVLSSAEGGSSSGTVTSESIDGYSVTYGSTAVVTETTVSSEYTAAAPYRRKRFGVG